MNNCCMKLINPSMLRSAVRICGVKMRPWSFWHHALAMKTGRRVWIPFRGRTSLTNRCAGLALGGWKQGKKSIYIRSQCDALRVKKRCYFPSVVLCVGRPPKDFTLP